MWQTMRMAAYALAATLALSGFSLAQRDRDDDDDQGYYRQGYGDQARQYGYQNGYNDGVQKGRHEGRERDPYDYQTPDWRQARRGYQQWMGPAELYHRAYQQGYRNGFESGYEEYSQNWNDGYRGNTWQSNGWQTGYDGDGIANRFGQEDGAQEAARHGVGGERPGRGPVGEEVALAERGEQHVVHRGAVLPGGVQGGGRFGVQDAQGEAVAGAGLVGFAGDPRGSAARGGRAAVFLFPTLGRRTQRPRLR